MTAKAILFCLLTVLGIAFLAFWARVERGRATGAPSGQPGQKAFALRLGIGALTNFFDQLGIGSFATTTSLYKLGHVVDDDNIPGTLNVGHTPATFAEAFISIALIDVDTTTLVSMIASAVAGAHLGAGVVARWPKRKIQIGMGILLLVAALIIAVRQLALVHGGDALGVTGALLAVGVIGNFFLGALMTLGIGLFAPCMILVSLLGMDPKTAFPIMMGSCAFLMPVAGFRFIRSGRYDFRAALGLALGGVPAVLVAAYIVKSLPLSVMKWLVVAVVVYTATAMLRSARKRAA